MVTRFANKSSKVSRPLLKMHRFEIRQFIRFWKLPVYSDQSNKKTNFSRNKVRKQLMPVLRIFFNPQIDTVLLNFAEIRKCEQLYFQNILNFLLKPQESYPAFFLEKKFYNFRLPNYFLVFTPRNFSYLRQPDTFLPLCTKDVILSSISFAYTPLPLSPSEIEDKIARTPFAFGDHPVPLRLRRRTCTPVTPKGNGVRAILSSISEGERGNGLPWVMVRLIFDFQRQRGMGYGIGKRGDLDVDFQGRKRHRGIAFGCVPLRLYPLPLRGDRLWRKRQRCIGVQGDRLWRKHRRYIEVKVCEANRLHRKCTAFGCFLLYTFATPSFLPLWGTQPKVIHRITRGNSPLSPMPKAKDLRSKFTPSPLATHVPLQGYRCFRRRRSPQRSKGYRGKEDAQPSAKEKKRESKKYLLYSHLIMCRIAKLKRLYIDGFAEQILETVGESLLYKSINYLPQKQKKNLLFKSTTELHKVKMTNWFHYGARNQVIYWLILNDSTIKVIHTYPSVFQKLALKSILKTFAQVENALTEWNEKKLMQLLIVNSTKKMFTQKEKSKFLILLYKLLKV